MKTNDWAALREEFPTVAHWCYLDIARKTVPPRCQEQTVTEYYRDVYENAGADAWSALNVASTRTELAALLGAKPAEIAFTKNTTEGLTIAANAFDLKPGDNIVLTSVEHVANIWVWKHWEAKGVEIRYAQARDGRLPLESFLEKMDSRTRIVSTAYVTYGTGYRVNLPPLGAACAERGIKLVVDGVQGAGILSAPLSGLGADMIAIGGHKGLLGLTGSGILYCREELVDQVLAPFVQAASLASSARVKGHVNSQFDYVRVAHRFEGGNPNFLGLRVLRRSAQFLQSIGIAQIEQRIRGLTTYCMSAVRKAGLKTQTPESWDERAQIVNVVAPDAEAVMNRLKDKHRVIVNVKDNNLRLSMSFFNNEEDIDKAVRAIAIETGSKTAVAA
jgi:selenocysteine lyase/cysteine desulfurase